jgi:hypothetical protein
MATITRAANQHTVVATGWTNPSYCYSTTTDSSYATIATAKNSTLSGDYGFAAFTTADIPDNATVSVVVYTTYGMSAAVTGGLVGLQARRNSTSTTLGSEITRSTASMADANVTATGATLDDLRTSNEFRVRARGTKGNTSNASTAQIDRLYIIVTWQPPAVTFTADAVIKATVAGTGKNADAIVKKTQSGSFSASAEIAIPVVTQSGSFTADTITKRTTAGSFSADAIIQATVTPTGFSADAVIKRTWGGAVYRETVLAASPVGYWRLGEPSGTTAEDETSGNHDLTYTGSPTLGEPGALVGDPDTAVTFVGQTDYASIASGVEVSTPYSVEYWAKASAANYMTVRLGSAGYPMFLMGRPDFGRPLTRLNVNCFRYWSAYPDDGEWHHFVFVVPADDITTTLLYLDGSSVTPYSTTTTDPELAPDGSVYINFVTIDSNSVGIDEVAVYSEALPAGVALAHYNTGKGNSASFSADAYIKATVADDFAADAIVKRTITPTGFSADAVILKTMQPYRGVVLGDQPVAYWRLGEPSGTTAYDEIGTADADYINTPALGSTGLVTGDTDSAVVFNGSNEYVLGTGVVPGGSSDGATIECWVRFDALPATDAYAFLASWGPNSASEGQLVLYYYHGASSKVLRIQFTDGTKRYPELAWTPSTGVTYHIVASHDYVAKTIPVWINGQLLGTMDLSAYGTPKIIPADTAVYIASNATAGWYVNGAMDEVAFYDYPLSASQATTHYITGKGGIVGFTADAFIISSVTDDFSTDAIVKATQPGSFSADAIILRTQDRGALFAYDTFTRTTSNGWGTADLGGAWNNTSSKLSTDGDEAKAGFTANESLTSTLSSINETNSDQLIQISFDKLPNSGQVNAGLISRFTSPNYYNGKIYLLSSGTYRLWLTRNDSFDLGYVTGSYTAGDIYWLRFQTVGSLVRAKTWEVGTAEPDWQISALDSNLTAAGDTGVFLYATGATNWPITVTLDNYSAAYPFAITASAVIAKTQSGSFSASAVIKATESDSFSADAVVFGTQSDSFSADGVIKATITPTSFTADAVILKTTSTSDTAFPSVDHLDGGFKGNDVPFTVTFPGGAPSSGELLVVVLGENTNVSINAKAGWTELCDASAVECILGVLYRIADGTEGTSTQFFSSPQEKGGGWQCYVITNYSGVPEISAVATSGSPSYDPPSLSPSWGSAKTLWLAVMAHDGSIAITGAPSNYTDLRADYWNNFEGAGCASARRELEAASEDPGAFTSGSGEQWAAATVAIKGMVSTPPITADAIIVSAVADDFSADAIVQATASDSFAADAITLTTESDSFSADAEIESGVVTQFGDFTADAVVLRTQSGSFGADAVIKRTWGPGTYAATVLADSPVGYWRLGESGGTDAVDQTGTQNGVYRFAPTLGVTGALTGDANTAITCNGTDQYVRVNNNTGQNVGDTFTVEAWVNRGATGAKRTILSESITGPTFELDSDGKLRGSEFNSDTTYVLTDDALTTGWHHVVLTKNGSESHIYVDGEEPAHTHPGTVTCSDGTTYLCIGAIYQATDHGYWNGSLDEVALYGTALTSAQVATHYAAGTAAHASFVASAITKKTQADSFTASAVIRATQPGSFAADAVILRGQSDSFSADAIIKKTWGGYDYAAEVLADSPLGYWRLDEPSGTLANNIGTGGDTYDGTITNDPTLGVSGALANDPDTAIYFDRTTSEYIVGAGMPIGYSDFTIEAWITFPLNSSFIMWDSFNEGYNAGSRLSYGIAGGQWASFNISSGYFIDVQLAYGDVWHHFVGTADRDGYMRFYIDGREVGSKDFTGASGWNVPNGDDFYIGRRRNATTPYHFTGDVDEVAYYLSALPAERVLVHYGAAKGGATFLASAVTKKTQSGSFTASAVIKATASDSFAADAVVLLGQSASITADAIATKSQGGSFTASAVIAATQSDDFSADAFISATRAGSLSADGIVKGTQSNSLAADAIVGGSTSGSFAADSILRTTTSQSLSADAWVLDPHPQFSFSASAFIQTQTSGFVVTSAIIKATIGSSFSADAIFEKGFSDSFTASAFILASRLGSLAADAVVRSTATGLLVADSVVKRSALADLTADAIVRRTYGYSWSADAIAKATIPGDFSADAFISAARTGLFTADSIAKGEQLGSIGADAVVRSTASGLLAADAVIRRTTQADLTTDAIVRRATSGNYSADAVVRRLITGSFSGDAIVEREASGSLTADAWVLDPHPEFSFTADAFIKTATSGFITTSAVIKGEQAGSFSADAILRWAVSGDFTASAFILAERAGSISGDAVVRRTGAEGVAADAVIRRVESASLTTDAILLLERPGALYADAIVRAIGAGSLSADAVVRRTTSEPFTADAVLQRFTSASLTTDAIIRATPAGSFGADAIVKGSSGAVSFTADAVILRPGSGSFTADAWVLEPHPQFTFTADAFILTPTSGFITLSAVFFGTQSASFTADAVIGATRSADFSASALVNATRSDTLYGDAVILRAQETAATADAIVARPQTAELTASAVIRTTRTYGFSADAVSLSPSSGSLVADAVVLSTTSGWLSADALLVETKTGAFTASANITSSGQGSFSADAVISRTTSASLTADALILATNQEPVSLSAVILKPVAQQLTADATVRGTEQGQLLVDAIVLSVHSESFTASAYIALVVSHSFTASSYFIASRSQSFSADAIIGLSPVYSFSADAFISTWRQGSFVTDAVVRSTRTTAVSASAVLRGERVSLANLDAIVRATRSTSATLDAILRRTAGASFTASAYIRRLTFTADAYLIPSYIPNIELDASLSTTEYAATTGITEYSAEALHTELAAVIDNDWSTLMTTLVQGDYKVTVASNIYEKDSDPVTYVNLGGCSVKFRMRKEDDKRFTVDEDAVITSVASGGVMYEFDEHDLDVAGDYLIFWRVTFTDGRIQSTSEGIPVTVRRK